MRDTYKNLQGIIVDEFSMMKPEILYRIDLRLKEIKQNNKYFGGVALFIPFWRSSSGIIVLIFFLVLQNITN